MRVIRSIAVQSRDDPDCLSYRIYRDIEDHNVLVLQGTCESEENLDIHIRSDEYRNLLLVLEMSLKQPEVKFNWY